MMHPQIMPTARAGSDLDAEAIPTVGDCTLPLVPAIGSQSRTRIGCETCHNPHAGRGERSLLRTPNPTHPEKVCFQCHKSEATLDHSMHAKNVLARSLGTVDSKLLCAPCHAVHAVEGSQKDKLWAGRLDISAATPNEQRCLGCHDDQTARRPAIPSHPSVEFGLLKWSATRPSSLPQYLPTERSIPCGVCHLPHGNKNAVPAAVLAAGTNSSPEQLVDLRGATKPMMRPAWRTICAPPATAARPIGCSCITITRRNGRTSRRYRTQRGRWSRINERSGIRNHPALARI